MVVGRRLGIEKRKSDPMPKHTRAGQKIRWIEMHCVTPFGPDRGSVFRLNDAEKPTICQIYVCQQQDGPIIGNLAGYIALLNRAVSRRWLMIRYLELRSVAGLYGGRQGLLSPAAQA
jgi:hypothetical protein